MKRNQLTENLCGGPVGVSAVSEEVVAAPGPVGSYLRGSLLVCDAHTTVPRKMLLCDIRWDMLAVMARPL